MLYGFYGPIALTLLSPIEYSFGTVALIAVIAASHGYMAPDSYVLLFINIYMAHIDMAPLVVNASIAPPMAPLLWHIYGIYICSVPLALFAPVALLTLFWHIYIYICVARLALLLSLHESSLHPLGFMSSSSIQNIAILTSMTTKVNSTSMRKDKMTRPSRQPMECP